MIPLAKIIDKANSIQQKYQSSDPYVIAEELDIIIMERDFKKQLGVYMPVLDQPFIFLKADLEDEMKKIVLLHEIGHHILHRESTTSAQFFPEYSLYRMDNRMEFEANAFASQILLPDEEFLEYLQIGYGVHELAHAMHSDPNLIALKVEILNQRGYKLNQQEYTSKFLS